MYREKLRVLQADLDESEFQQELFVRGGLFKKEIPKIYGFACCISQMRVESISNAQLIDACHIIPFSESYDDTIKNGICLSPNLHRAFDRGLITIDSNYRVKVSSGLSENEDSPFSIRQFEGQTIHLPENPVLHPDISNLQWHLNQVFVS